MVWKPKKVWRFPNEKDTDIAPEKSKLSLSTLIRAWTPFLLLIVFIANWAFSGTKSLLERYNVVIPFGPLNHAIIVGGHTLTIEYTFQWLAAAGTSIFLAAILSAILMHMPVNKILQVAGQTVKELRNPLIIIASIVGFAYLANYSGMSATMSKALANTGKVFPLVAPLLGWLGVFITGSDTSSNALFSTVQSHTASALHINPVLTVASNSTGGVAAKMISPQNIAVAAAATKLTNQEGKLFRKVILHSVALISIICLIAYLQAEYFKWMIPPMSTIQAQGTAHFDKGDLLIIVLSLIAIAGLGIISYKGNLHRHKNRPASELV